MTPGHILIAVAMSLVLGCEGDTDPTPFEGTGSTSGSTSSSTSSTSEDGITTSSSSESTNAATTSGPLTDSSGSESSEESSDDTSGTGDTSGSSGEAVTACGVVDPLLCEDFESADPLADWTVTELAGTEVTIEDSDPPNEPAVVRARTTPTAISNIAEIRRLVDGVDEGVLVATLGAWIRFDAACVDADDAPFVPLTLVFHLVDDPGGLLEVTASLALGADGGELRLGSAFTHPILPFTDFSWEAPIAADSWHQVDITMDLEAGTAIVVFDREVVIDEAFDIEETEPLLPQVLAGLYVPLDHVYGDCSVRVDDIYVTAP